MRSIEIARKMETDAIDFYTEAAAKTRYPAGKKMFEVIIVDEKRHLEMIDKLIANSTVNMEDAHPFENIKTVFEEMKDQMMERVAVTDDEFEAFRIAMRMEKEGIEFYRKLLIEAASEEEKALIEKLIKEEGEHYEIFANTYSFISDTGNWFMWEEHSIVEG
ncbi:MAG TPA: rubrerythrin [Nitrospirae bacterium]|nr:rubrerythrin [bacterium BMS3Abin09]GBE41565.1 rubrerythrin [bacterium BMS3Bbin09]HDH34855.1 rubrerythrin [Nitrospirota bacterium]HDO67409.1 rubrerythrin [Nitrospirota bacterium]HDZ84862.1 rubrerythrin [Nitrospirota bacterium]